jgi:hypothetical protein
MRTERVDIDQVRNQLADLIAFASEGGEVIIEHPGAYRSASPSPTEFSSDEESLAWDADGWEEIA